MTLRNALPRAFAVATAVFLGAALASAQSQPELIKALSNKRFANVKSSDDGNTVTLTGTVNLLADKVEAEKRIHRVVGPEPIQNQIQVAGPVVEDAALANKLGEKVAYDRVGYGSTAFNAITVSVKNGIVTLGGVAMAPVDKDSAISLVENYPGVKGLVDNVTVAPTSNMDDRVRLAAYRAIYSAPQLNHYGMDPVKPIRIVVVNGNITLVGTVDSEADKNVANIRANGVPGAFKVTNDLQVASSER